MPSLEVFTNDAVGTVTAGGTTTSDTAFTVTPTNPFPVASTSTNPQTFFRVIDTAAPTEIMWVTVCPGGGSSGQSWTVLRAQEGTTAIAHTSGWTVQQLISAGTMQNLKQTPSAATSTVTVNSTTETAIATYQPVTGEIVPGTSYEAIAFGTLQRLGGTGPGQMTWRIRWGWVNSGTPGTAVLSLVTGTNGPTGALTTIAAGMSWDCNGTVTFIDTTHAVANLNHWWQSAATTVNTELASGGSGVVVSGSGPLALTCQIGGTLGTSEQLVAPAPLIYRAA